ncbi:MAG: RdgB/HAM1 family non-canonical purine NTP pyrophosphatase [Alphaproteobacteria bacterium]|nr:RdgB/HAM1 family non-canonical purine NTP pyrophosphatase [Alphaproteobacteria bacterium]
MTHRSFTHDSLIIATHNKGKQKEIMVLFKPFVKKLFTAQDFNLSEPEETGLTFIENAELKSLAASMKTNLPALADDSGLVIPALDGEPGIYSARWAGPQKDFNCAMDQVQQKLEKKGAHTKEQRKAWFICVLSLAWPDHHVENFEGRIDGHITWSPRGHNGFGYDPIFVPDGYDITFGEMDPNQKHLINHRALAFNQLIQNCFS